MKKQVFILLFFSVLISGCQTFSLQMKAPLADEGVVYLYSKPFPQEAGRLSFSLESIQAIDETGKSNDLVVSLPNFSAKETGRQRLIASGPLPPGAYSGFILKFKTARLRSEQGDVALHVPETSVRLSYPFRLLRRKGLVISMAFQYQESLQNGVIFNPVFSFTVPDKPVITLTGFVSDNDSNSVMVFATLSSRTNSNLRSPRIKTPRQENPVRFSPDVGSAPLRLGSKLRASTQNNNTANPVDKTQRYITLAKGKIGLNRKSRYGFFYCGMEGNYRGKVGRMRDLFNNALGSCDSKDATSFLEFTGRHHNGSESCAVDSLHIAEIKDDFCGFLPNQFIDLCLDVLTWSSH